MLEEQLMNSDRGGAELVLALVPVLVLVLVLILELRLELELEQQASSTLLRAQRVVPRTTN